MQWAGGLRVWRRDRGCGRVHGGAGWGRGWAGGLGVGCFNRSDLAAYASRVMRLPVVAVPRSLLTVPCTL